MTDRPIIFSAPMIRALIDGRKRMTRRVLSPQLQIAFAGKEAIVRRHPHQKGIGWDDVKRLWVREAWRTEARYDGSPPRNIPHTAIVSYEADYDHEPNDGCRGRYRHARFMPRAFSRLTLLVESVKVERLQDISEEDAIAEGAEQYSSSTKLSRPFNPDWKGIYREGFAELWNSINGPDAWDANPWVAAIGFSVIKANIDSLGAE